MEGQKTEGIKRRERRMNVKRNMCKKGETDGARGIDRQID